MPTIVTQLHNFINYIENHSFDTYEVYIWSNFGFNSTGDIDLIFVGKITEEIGKKLYNFQEDARANNLNIDITLLPDTRIFSYIPAFNQATTRYTFPEKIIRYKLCAMQGDQWDNGWKSTQHSKYLWKLEQRFARKDTKYKTRDWHYPMLLENFIKLYKNIKNEN